jgi:hypothetical protein
MAIKVSNSTIIDDSRNIIDVKSTRGTITALATNASDINLSLGSYFVGSTSAGSISYSFTNVPTSTYFSFVLELTIGSTIAITWPTTVKWPGDSAPTVTSGKTHLYVFVTDDGGSRWRGAALSDYTT